MKNENYLGGFQDIYLGYTEATKHGEGVVRFESDSPVIRTIEKRIRWEDEMMLKSLSDENLQKLFDLIALEMEDRKRKSRIFIVNGGRAAGRKTLRDRIFSNDFLDYPDFVSGDFSPETKEMIEDSKKSSVWKPNCEQEAKKCEVEEGGSYYVFNPNKDKPRKLYDNYKEALADCKKVAELAQERVLVLKVVAEAEVHKMIYVKERGLNNGQVRNI